jgi:hypothetical protein
VRQRAVICQDCWFWKEMSCALASPVNDVCANRRPVHGRRAQRPALPAQASLVPLAAGHASPDAPERLAPAARAPFAETAPEATFSLTQVREPDASAVVPPVEPEAMVQPLRSNPPSFREIRSGRAAASSRAPIAEVRIPISELERSVPEAAPAQCVLPGIDQLVERVRLRTAARLSRAAVSHA